MTTSHRMLPTDIPGLDALLGGGLLPSALVFIVGPPGAGKTILAHQILFHHARGARRACSSAPTRRGMKN